MPIDPLIPISAWLKRQYPRPPINPAWLKQSYDAVLEATPTLQTPELIRQINAQLLASHLSHSLLPTTATPGLPIAADHNALPPQTLFFPTEVDLPTGHGKTKKDGGCLVMITEITEIGHSAYSLASIKGQRAEALSGVTRIRRMPAEREREDGFGGGAADEDEDEADMPPYPRSMLMLRVTDGKVVLRAMEYQRIEGLKLGESVLGSKMILRNVRLLRGILLLTPANTTLLEDSVYEPLDQEQGQRFENGLRERMGKEPLPLEDNDEAVPEPAPAQRSAPARVAATAQDVDLDMDIDIDAQPSPSPPPHRARPSRATGQSGIKMAGGGAREFLAMSDPTPSPPAVGMEEEEAVRQTGKGKRKADQEGRGGAVSKTKGAIKGKDKAKAEEEMEYIELVDDEEEGEVEEDSQKENRKPAPEMLAKKVSGSGQGKVKGKVKAKSKAKAGVAVDEIIEISD